jgi:hypothetical protein
LNIVGTYEVIPGHDYLCTYATLQDDWKQGTRHRFTLPEQTHLIEGNTYKFTLYDDGSAQAELIKEKEIVEQAPAPYSIEVPIGKKYKKKTTKRFAGVK